MGVFLTANQLSNTGPSQIFRNKQSLTLGVPSLTDPIVNVRISIFDNIDQ